MKYENRRIFCDCGAELEEGDFGMDSNQYLDEGTGWVWGVGDCPNCGEVSFTISYKIIDIEVNKN